FLRPHRYFDAHATSAPENGGGLFQDTGRRSKVLERVIRHDEVVMVGWERQLLEHPGDDRGIDLPSSETGNGVIELASFGFVTLLCERLEEHPLRASDLEDPG